jgi:hypothetical protein
MGGLGMDSVSALRRPKARDEPTYTPISRTLDARMHGKDPAEG